MRRLTLAAIPFCLLAACGDRPPSEPVTFAVVADSIVRIAHDTLSDGSITANCSISLTGTPAGPEGEGVIMRGGRIQYWWWASGAEATTYEWTPEAVHNFWVDSIIDVGETRTSREQGFGQSVPANLVRAEVVFDYATTNSDSVKQTPPFRFYCF
jgi:hypothetical protein